MLVSRHSITRVVISAMSLKVLIMAVALLSFPDDTHGQTLKLKKYNLKTRNMAVKEIDRTDSTVIYAWTALVANYEKDTLRFNIKVLLTDDNLREVYSYLSDSAYVLANGDGDLFSGFVVMPNELDLNVKKYVISINMRAQLRYEAAIKLYEALKKSKEKIEMEE